MMHTSVQKPADMPLHMQLGPHPNMVHIISHGWCIAQLTSGSPAHMVHLTPHMGQEPAGSGQYNKFYEEGVYKCAGCGTPLYK